ncbi:hypothetical protein Tco_1006152, partial [Tanacetum coccineum]
MERRKAMIGTFVKKIFKSVPGFSKSLTESLLKSRDFISKIGGLRRRKETVRELGHKIVPSCDRIWSVLEYLSIERRLGIGPCGGACPAISSSSRSKRSDGSLRFLRLNNRSGSSIGDQSRLAEERDKPTGWDDNDNNGIKSFANVVSASTPKSKLNFRTLFNEDKVEETDFVLPLAVVEVVKHKFDNTLVGFFEGHKVAFPLVKNYIMNTWSKFGVQKVMRDNEGVHYFKFDSPNRVDQVLQQGLWMIRNTPLILNKWTPNLSLAKDKVTKVPLWVKLHRVHVVAYSEDGMTLIVSHVVSAEKDLKENVIMAIPLENGEGYSKENIRVEYEWKPPTCSYCRVFGHHMEKYPKRPVERAPVVVETNMEENNDGFVKVNNRKSKGKGSVNNQKKNAIGFKVGNNQNLRYQPVKPKSNDKKSDDDQQDNGIKLKNLFEKLNDITILVTDSSRGMKLRIYLVIPLKSHNSRKILIGLNRTPKQFEVRQVVSENQLSACAILESHVDVSLLSDVCSRVFKSWEWTSNANLCKKGCRIILGWNIDVVNIMVISQTNQAMHVNITHKVTNKIMFCSFIYAGNLPAERRFLWAELDLHKHVVCRFPWTLMGDFNVALNLEDYLSSLSCLNSAMNDFKACVNKIKVMDINSTGLHYTWNQKPRSSRGVLKKLDRIIGNMDFIDTFPGACGWNVNTEGYHMFRVVTKMKALKKPLRKLLHSYGNLHERVNAFRIELDEIQKALDRNPLDTNLRDEEAAYVSAFIDAKLDEVATPLKLVKTSQPSFRVEELLTNNPHPLMHNYPRDRGPPRCAFKVDIQKAYDTVDWKFLSNILNLFGFHKKMVKWIMACVSSASFSLLINGDIHGYFNGKRGLRKGDPISSYLFTLVMEVLTLIIKRRVRLSNMFRYHNRCKELELINVCFADDLLIFTRGEVHSARLIMEALNEFQKSSGLVPSIPKAR